MAKQKAIRVYYDIIVAPSAGHAFSTYSWKEFWSASDLELTQRARIKCFMVEMLAMRGLFDFFWYWFRDPQGQFWFFFSFSILPRIDCRITFYEEWKRFWSPPSSKFKVDLLWKFSLLEKWSIYGLDKLYLSLYATTEMHGKRCKSIMIANDRIRRTCPNVHCAAR